MGLTLFIVPALQVSYLEWRARRARAPIEIRLRAFPAGGAAGENVGLATLAPGPSKATEISATEF